MPAVLRVRALRSAGREKGERVKRKPKRPPPADRYGSNVPQGPGRQACIDAVPCAHCGAIRRELCRRQPGRYAGGYGFVDRETGFRYTWSTHRVRRRDYQKWKGGRYGPNPPAEPPPDGPAEIREPPETSGEQSHASPKPGVPSGDPLPCPFCGSARLENFDGNYLKCTDCSATGPLGGGFSPVLQWNRRAEPSRAEFVAELRRNLAEERKFPDLVYETIGAFLEGVANGLNESTVSARSAIPVSSARTALNTPTGTRVQCGPLTLNILPGHKSKVRGRRLTIWSPDGKAAWAFVHVPPEQDELTEFSFST